MDYIHLRLPRPDGQQLLLGHVYKNYYSEIRQFAYKLVDNYQQAEDITQESFIKLHNKNEFDDSEHVKYFLYRVTKNACFDVIRSRKRKELHKKDYNYLAEKFVPGLEFSGKLAFLKLAFHKGLRKEIEQIPHSCKEVTALHFLEGKSFPEIAAMLSVSPQYVGKQQKTCIEILKNRFLQFLKTNTPFSLVIFILIATYFVISLCRFCPS